MYKFKVGDLIRLKNGKTKMIVADVENFKDNSQMCSLIYCKLNRDYSDTKAVYKRWAEDLILWHRNDPNAIYDYDSHLQNYEPKDIKMTNTSPIKKDTLFQTKEKKPRYGTFLIENSEGKYVLELKGGNGAVEAFTPDSLEKVTPYTIRCKIINDGNHVCDYAVSKDLDIVVGDILISNSGHMYLVTMLNSGCEEPKSAFKGCKLNTTKIG